MDDSFFDFQLNGRAYRLPCGFEKLAKEGWVINKSPVQSLHNLTDELAPKTYSLMQELERGNGAKIQGGFFNHLTRRVTAEQATLVRLIATKSAQTNGTDFLLSGFIGIGSSKAEVMEVFGEPSEEFRYSGWAEWRYGYNYREGIRFTIDSQSDLVTKIGLTKFR